MLDDVGNGPSATPSGRAARGRAGLLRVGLVVGGAVFVVIAGIGAVAMTGYAGETVSSVGISYDFEPRSGTHGGTVASLVKADLAAFGISSQGSITVASDQPQFACYLVGSVDDGAAVSLVEVFGPGPGAVAGVSRWTGTAWQSARAGARPTDCEAIASHP